VDSPDKFAAFVNQEARLSFYADFLYPLASESTLEQYYRETPEGDFTPELEACRTQLWETLHQYRLKLLRLSQSRFIHFGTTAQLLALMTIRLPQYRALGWDSRVLTNSTEPGFAVNCAYIEPGVPVGKGSYIEDSVLLRGSAAGEGCIISGIALSGKKVPSGAVVHGLKLQDGRFVVRMYAVEDDPKMNSLFGRPLPEPLWTAPLFPVRDTVGEALEETLKRYEAGFPDKASGTDLISLKESFNQVDQQALLDWQDEVSEKVNLAGLLHAIQRRLPLHEPAGALRRVTPKGLERLSLEANKGKDNLERFGRRIRIYYALSHLAGEDETGKHFRKVFQEISDTMRRHSMHGEMFTKGLKIKKDEVAVQLPVRVNFGGGWSDTPPYCLENGGVVLNAAITLSGEPPAEAVVRKLENSVVVLASEDSDTYEEFSDIALLRDCSDPLDPFALHKAALITCGLIPGKGRETLEQVLARLGGGLSLSTQVKGIPRGSGLGTSSILGAACVKALSEFTGTLMTDKELFSRVLCMEQLMSTGGGWQDQAGGFIPGIKLLSTTPGLEQNIRCEEVRMLPLAMRELNERFCLIYTGQRRLARNLLRDVVTRYISGDREFADTLYSIQRLAVLMRFELEKGNITGFGNLLSEHWALSKRLDSGCTNDIIEAIFNAVDELVDGKMICGAGGGGFLQVVMKPGISRDDLRLSLKKAQLNNAINIWDSEFVV
jgi:fucokinase